MAEERQKLDGYYLVDTKKQYEITNPSPLDNLLRLYNLEPIAKSFARTNPDGSKGVKLRKSYRNHIQDLPGKHQVSAQKAIPSGLLDPMVALAPDLIKAMDSEMLGQAMKFDKTPINGIPGFKTSDLAINDLQTLMRGDDMSENDDYGGGKKSKRKTRNQGVGHDIKRQHV